MTYGKLVSNKLQMVPPQIKFLEQVHNNPDADFLASEGYKPVIFTTPPQVTEGHTLIFNWSESTNCITQTWTVV